MGVKSKGRGAAATFGLLLLLAGIAGAVVLWLMADRRPDQAVDGFARGPVGCTTTLEFSDTGRFYLYEEVVASSAPPTLADCEPVAVPGLDFSARLLDDGRPVAIRDDTSISYETDTASGTSIGWVDVAEPGRYDLVVEGSDPSTVAAIGRDPDDGVDDLRRGAIAVGAVGVVLGGLMLLLAGRRSRRAATYQTPTGPGWSARPPDVEVPAWPPEAPRVPQMPVNPMLPSEPVPPQPVPPEPASAAPSDAPPPPTAEPTRPAPSPDVAPAEPAVPASTDPVPAGDTAGSPWAPPEAGERRDPPPTP